MSLLVALTLVHTLISLVGILTGFVVLAAMLDDRHPRGWVRWFLVTTILTSATGYLFPVTKVMPSHIVGAISLAVLIPATYALYSRQLAGGWRKVYVIGSVVGLYFNTFVLVAQGFAKVPVLKAAAPTQSEPPFAIAQLIVMIAFIVFGYRAVKKFRGLPGLTPSVAIS